MPQTDVIDALPEGAFRGDWLKSHIHYLCRVILNESGAVKACNVGSAVESVSAVHDVAHPVCYVKGLGKHAGSHEAHEVGLNLEIKVVGVGVVEPVAAFRGHDALADVVPSGLVGMGKVIWRVGKAQREVFGRCPQSQLLEGLRKGEVVVNVVKQAWFTVPPVLDVAFSPANGDFLRNYGSAELEFRGGTVNHPYCLSCPAALDLVHEGVP